MRSVINASLGTCAKPFAEEEPTDHSIRWVGREVSDSPRLVGVLGPQAGRGQRGSRKEAGSLGGSLMELEFWIA